MDSLMDNKLWSRAWALFMTDPVPFGTRSCGPRGVGIWGRMVSSWAHRQEARHELGRTIAAREGRTRTHYQAS
jgi:hypothetical protein